MPHLNVDLYDDSKTAVVAYLNVICSEPEARFLESWLLRNRYLKRLLPVGASHNMTFKQFKQIFIEHKPGLSSKSVKRV